MNTLFLKSGTALTLALIMSVSAPASIYASATPSFHGIAIQDQSQQDLGTIWVDGEEIDLNQYFNDLKTTLTPTRTHEIRASIDAVEINGVKSKAVKAAAKWLKATWPKFIEKAPAAIKQYLKAEIAFDVIDYFVEISDSVNELVYNVFRAIIPNAVSDNAVRNFVEVIMLFAPGPF